MSANWNLDNFMSLQMLPLTGSTIYPVSKPPNANPVLGSILISLLLLTPNKVDYVENQVFSIFLFFVLYSLFHKSFLPFTPLYSSTKGDCLLNEVLNKVCLYHLNYIFNTASKEISNKLIGSTKKVVKQYVRVVLYVLNLRIENLAYILHAFMFHFFSYSFLLYFTKV